MVLGIRRRPSTQDATTAGATTLTYDFEGRATSIVGPGVSQFNVFNGLDTRVGSTTNSVARTFLRDGAYVTDPVLSDGAAAYTPGISERRGSTTTFLHSGLKNADAQSGVSQSLTAARHYDAFGNLLGASGSWQGLFGYAGAFGYQEDATGLMLLGHRLFDPSTGRNWYVYCGNDAINFFDDNGLTPKVLIFYGGKLVFKGGQWVKKRIVYHIHKSERAAKLAARAERKAKIIREENGKVGPKGPRDLGHEGGPPHWHGRGGANPHHTRKREADAADRKGAPEKRLER